MITGLLLATVLACVPPSDTSVVGFWESATTSHGGIGTSIELNAQGEMLSATSVMVDQVYRAADGKLFVAGSSQALNALTEGTTFTITKNLLVETDGRGGEVRKERLGDQGQPGGSPIGAWRYRHYTGAVAFELYTADGRMLFRLPMASQQGCFKAADGSLTLDFHKEKSTLRYTRDSGTLTLRGADGKSNAYRRADPWYPRDQIDYRPPTTGGW